MKTGEHRIPSSAKDKRKKKRGEVRRSLLLIGLILLLLSGCRSSSGDAIYGSDLGKLAKLSDALHTEQVVQSQQEKYERHFQNGLFFEDLSAAQQELNEAFNRHLSLKMKRRMKDHSLLLGKAPFFLQSEVEYVNAEAKAYAEGKKTAEEIIDDPNAMMSLKMRFYFFDDADESEKKSDLIYGLWYRELEEEFREAYFEKGIEEVELWVRYYDPSVLERYSMEELKKEPQVETLLQEEKSSMELHMLQTPYCRTATQESEPVGFYGGIMDEPDRVKKRLKKKYQIEFDQRTCVWASPKGKPELFFRAYYTSDKDMYACLLFQHLLRPKVQELIDQAGLGDRVACFIATDPFRTDPFSYDFREGYDEEEFLRTGYKGYAAINLIYFDDEPPEGEEGEEERFGPKEELTEHEKTIRRLMAGKLQWPLHKMVHLGRNTYYEDGKERIGATKVLHCSLYRLSEYERRVAIELFRRQPLTARAEAEGDHLYDVYSERYHHRAEIQAYHYLDIFGEREHLFRLEGYNEVETEPEEPKPY